MVESFRMENTVWKIPKSDHRSMMGKQVVSIG